MEMKVLDEDVFCNSTALLLSTEVIVICGGFQEMLIG